MRKSQISASMMCSNLVDLQATIDVFEKEKVEYLHIDVMDGEFVPNFGLGVDYIRGLRELTSIPLDLHLMIKDPEYKLPWIGIHKEDIILEVDGNITKEHGATLRSCGASIFVAGTSSIFCTDVSHFGEKIREFRKAVE